MESKVCLYQNTAAETVGSGVTRRVLAYLPEMMMVEICFEEGSKGALHRHPHTQCTYVREGEFIFTVEGEVHTVGPGDTLAFAPNAEHGCVCKRRGTVIDVFTPLREDFIER